MDSARRLSRYPINALIALAAPLMFLALGEASAECPSSATLLKPCSRETIANSFSSFRSTGVARPQFSFAQGNRWTLTAGSSAAEVAAREDMNSESNTPVQRSFAQLRWADSQDWIHNPPDWVQTARDYRRRGMPMPIIHLMQSTDKSTLLAIGVGSHGKPGLYLTRNLPF
jgi:hypothetical protein